MAAIPTGVILPYTGNAAPPGWLLCNGARLDARVHGDLVNMLGGLALPDLRGRFLMGADAARPLASAGGAASVALNAAQLPAHQHAVGLERDHGVVGNNLQLSSQGNTYRFVHSGPFGRQNGGGQTSAEGQGQAFSILPPFFTVNYIIKI